MEWYGGAGGGGSSGNAYANAIDLSNATSDYNLGVGEVAIINFTNATSVPLHIATQDGTYYEMRILCYDPPGGTAGGGSGEVLLQPNNTTYANAFLARSVYRNSLGLGSGEGTLSAFPVGWNVIAGITYITNHTTYKATRSIYDSWGGTDGFPLPTFNACDWQDTTTPWTSLGTITFPQPTSGTIIVRRIK